MKQINEKAIEMSHVTDIILSTTIDDGAELEGEHPNTDQLNMYLNENHNGCSLVKADDKAGGGKAMQCDLFIAAINHLNIPDFLERFYQIAWEYPESVQLMLKDEHEDIFRIYQPRRVL